MNSSDNVVNPNGDSMYHAVIAALDKTDRSLLTRIKEWSYDQMMPLRKLVSDHLQQKINNRGEDDSEWYESFLCNIRPTGSQDSDQIIIVNYLTNIETSGNDGDDIVLQMLAEIFDVRIEVRNGNTLSYFGDEGNQRINLSFDGEVYYLQVINEADHLGATFVVPVSQGPEVAGIDDNSYNAAGLTNAMGDNNSSIANRLVGLAPPEDCE